MFSQEIQYEIGKRIRESRKNINKTQAEFAEGINISVNFLSEIENGKKGLSHATLYNICKIYHLSADYIFFGQLSESQQMPSQLIINSANELQPHELDNMITYLESLRALKQLDKLTSVSETNKNTTQNL